MGVISIENTDRLYWLGRYTERVYTTLRLFEDQFDRMIDDPNVYVKFCQDIDIPNIYSDSENFIDNYVFSTEDPNSIFSNLMRAYDNGIVLREMIGSESLSYIQLAVYDMNQAKGDQAPIIALQKVIDNILAFWGAADDGIDDGVVRNIVKTGMRIERLDLYARLGKPQNDMAREVRRLKARIVFTNLKYKQENLDLLAELVNKDDIDYYKVVEIAENLVEA